MSMMGKKKRGMAIGPMTKDLKNKIKIHKILHKIVIFRKKMIEKVQM